MGGDESTALQDQSWLEAETREDRAAEMKDRYKIAKQAKKGETVACPYCGRSHLKTTYHKAFCCPICKDRYWNYADDKRWERWQRTQVMLTHSDE